RCAARSGRARMPRRTQSRLKARSAARAHLLLLQEVLQKENSHVEFFHRRSQSITATLGANGRSCGKQIVPVANSDALGPYVAGANVVQENSTARVSQIPRQSTLGELPRRLAPRSAIAFPTCACGSERTGAVGSTDVVPRCKVGAVG